MAIPAANSMTRTTAAYCRSMELSFPIMVPSESRSCWFCSLARQAKQLCKNFPVSRYVRQGVFVENG